MPVAAPHSTLGRLSAACGRPGEPAEWPLWLRWAFSGGRRALDGNPTAAAAATSCCCKAVVLIKTWPGAVSHQQYQGITAAFSSGRCSRRWTFVHIGLGTDFRGWKGHGGSASRTSPAGWAAALHGLQPNRWLGLLEAHGVSELGLGVPSLRDSEGHLLCIDRVDTRSCTGFGVNAVGLSPVKNNRQQRKR